jgi:hypothetical protein
MCFTFGLADLWVITSEKLSGLLSANKRWPGTKHFHLLFAEKLSSPRRIAKIARNC